MLLLYCVCNTWHAMLLGMVCNLIFLRLSLLPLPNLAGKSSTQCICGQEPRCLDVLAATSGNGLFRLGSEQRSQVACQLAWASYSAGLRSRECPAPCAPGQTNPGPLSGHCRWEPRGRQILGAKSIVSRVSHEKSREPLDTCCLSLVRIKLLQPLDNCHTSGHGYSSA